MIFRIMNKSDNKVHFYRTANSVGAFMLGRRIDNYIVVKTDLPDDNNPRIVIFLSGDVHGIIQSCLNA